MSCEKDGSDSCHVRKKGGSDRCHVGKVDLTDVM